MKNSLLLTFLLVMSVFARCQQKEILYVGTYSVRGSEGIYVYEFNRDANSFTLIQSVNTPESPSFITIDRSGKFLFSVNRGSISGHPHTGSVSSFRIDPSTGKLTLINQRSSYGLGPCHVSTDHSGKFAFVSNYTEGNFVVYPIGADGSLGLCSDSIRFTGKSVDPTRQEKSHAHSALPSPDNRFVLVADLGADQLYSFSFDHRTGKLSPATTPSASVKPGSGPRHFTFHPNGKLLYLVEELTSSVAVLSYEKKTGKLALLHDQIKGLPADFTGENTAADIHTDERGKFLFMSNRGHQSIAVFQISDDGSIMSKYSQTVSGEKPRNFLVDTENQFLLVANQDTDNIVMFRFDERSGLLEETGTQIRIPSPVCLKMLTLK